jgi:membrane protease YdiL (CAAX protease family)
MKPMAMTRPARDGDGTMAFFALACLLTWALALPVALAWMHHRAPPPYAVACAGLSAFGPLLAALAVAGRRGQLGQVFGRWRTNPAWILLALCGAPLVHLAATALFAAVGGRPAQWFHPPGTPEALAALVVFPLGEEFGWRGFAHPRLVARFGPVRGCLIVGAVWGLWHLVYSITPAAAGFDLFTFGMTVVELPLYAVVMGWVFERANRSMAVAIAFHAGAHLDHIEMHPRVDLLLHALHLLVLAGVAAFAARALGRQWSRLAAPAPDASASAA